jgi:uncharacterized protein YdeI (YjbR/CyaY-like superfamily)
VEVNRDNLRFFRTSAELRRWLDKNHDKAQELWIGFYRKDSGKGGITYPQALDEALCYGWIDGIRKKLDDTSFTTRFTPRKKKSIWSNVNVRHVERLTKEGRMMPPGVAAFAAKDEKRTGVYSFEREAAELDPAMKKKFRQNPKAWKFFESQPPYYRKLSAWYVISARRDETREKRLSELIGFSAKERRLPPFDPASNNKKTK